MSHSAPAGVVATLECGRDPSKWLDVGFWTYFAVGMVAMVIWHASRVGTDDGVGWPIVFLLGFFAVLTAWGAVESGVKAWRASHTDSGHGVAAH